MNSDMTRIAGNDLNGTWKGHVTIPQFSEPGSWVVAGVFLPDKAGNNVTPITRTNLQQMGITPQLDVSCATPDLTPPQLLNLSFTPTFINASISDQTVTFDLTASDDRSGVDMSPDAASLSMPYGAIFERPSGHHYSRSAVKCQCHDAPSPWMLLPSIVRPSALT